MGREAASGGRRYPLTFTARGRANPVGHAGTGQRHGTTDRSKFAALCGAPVSRWEEGATFEPHHKRACPKCAKTVLDALGAPGGASAPTLAGAQHHPAPSERQ